MGRAGRKQGSGWVRAGSTRRMTTTPSPHSAFVPIRLRPYAPSSEPSAQCALTPMSTRPSPPAPHCALAPLRPRIPPHSAVAPMHCRSKPRPNPPSPRLAPIRPRPKSVSSSVVSGLKLLAPDSTRRTLNVVSSTEALLGLVARLQVPQLELCKRGPDAGSGKREGRELGGQGRKTGEKGQGGKGGKQGEGAGRGGKQGRRRGG